MSRENTIRLECGFEAKQSFHGSGKKKTEFLTISISGLFNEALPLADLAKLFTELSKGGYYNHGFGVDVGYYDSIDGYSIEVSRPAK